DFITIAIQERYKSLALQGNEKAFQWILQNTEKTNDPDLMAVVAECYKDGKGVNQDYTQAVYWYTKAAERGNPQAMFNLGECYENGQGVHQDHKQAVSWYTKAAERGNPQAMFNLGVCYANGQGVHQDYT